MRTSAAGRVVPLVLAVCVTGIAALPAPAEAACKDPISCCLEAGGDSISCICPVQNACAATQISVDLPLTNGNGASIGSLLSVEYLANNVSLFVDDNVYAVALTGNGIV